MLWDLITDLHDWPPQIDFFFYRSRLGFIFFQHHPVHTTAAKHTNPDSNEWEDWLLTAMTAVLAALWGPTWAKWAF